MQYYSTSYDFHGRKRKKAKAKGPVFEKYKPTFKPMTPTHNPNYRTSSFDNAPSAGDGIGNAPAKEANVYSGERQLLGVATMHKSNMVPVFADDDGKQYAKDLARMRRN